MATTTTPTSGPRSGLSDGEDAGQAPRPSAVHESLSWLTARAADAQNSAQEAKPPLPVPDTVPIGSRIGCSLNLLACLSAWLPAGKVWARAVLDAAVAWGAVRIVNEFPILPPASHHRRMQDL